MMCKCHGRCGKSRIASILMIVGGLNWGLAGLGMLLGSNLNVVNLILGSMPKIEAIVYLLVGIATIGVMFGCKCGKCKEAEAGCMGCKVGGDKSMSGASM